MTKIIGIMSGTSTDGLDLAYCDIRIKGDGSFEYEIIQSREMTYSDRWKERLRGAFYLSGVALKSLDVKYAQFIAECVQTCIREGDWRPDWIASHGHTVFHEPQKGISLQIGAGEIIADLTGIPTIYDFRIGDVQLGGQGAPLVPIGDELLFGSYTYCLNLGGFANISTRIDGLRVGYDIGPCNLLLNGFSRLLGKEYDAAGGIAREGRMIEPLLQTWNELDHYDRQPPKSLGREWVEMNYFIEDHSSYLPADLLRTAVEHIAMQIGRNTRGKGSMLITGGGAFNDFLIDRISHYSSVNITIPDEQLVNYKEALIFAFIGFLRVHEINNVLAEVTGAERDHCSGKIARPKDIHQ